MNTQTQTKTSTLSANLSQLPMMKHFSTDEIKTKVDTFRKGEKGLYNIIKYSLIAIIGWGIWTYVLPEAFVKLGQALALVATGIVLVLAYFLAKPFVKFVRMVARGIHKVFIKYDPFGQLRQELQKMNDNKTTFRIAKGGVDKLKGEMQNEARLCEENAEKAKKDILKLQGKANTIKAEMEAMKAKMGQEAESDDTYVSLASELQKVTADAARRINKMQQDSDFVQKYGTRFNIMKKMSQKLTMVETAMDIKIADFEATIEMLQKDYEFGQKANQATTAAKNAMLFSKGWEFDYAMDVVTSTIAADIAMTSGNLKDIATLTSNYALDSDDLYNNLNEIADKIKVGEIVIPEAKQYNNPNYRLTQSDTAKSGGFGDMF